MLNVKRFQSFKMCSYPFLVEIIVHSYLLRDVLFEENFDVYSENMCFLGKLQ